MALVTAALVQIPGGVTAAAESADPLPEMSAQSRAQEWIRPATVFVQTNWTARVITDNFGDMSLQWTEACTGTIVNSTGYIVTAGHCIDDGLEGAQGEAIARVVDALIESEELPASQRGALIEKIAQGNMGWIIQGRYRDSRPDRQVHIQVGGGHATWRIGEDPDFSDDMSARVLEVKPHSEGDVALLKVEQEDLPVAVVSPKSGIQEGDEVLAIGYPYGLANFAEKAQEKEIALTSRGGRIDSMDTEGQHGQGNLFYATSADLSDGMSGGATIDLDGQIVGLASSVSLQRDANYIVPATVVSELLSRNGVKNELGHLDTIYRAGLTDFYHGYYSDAINKFDQVTAIMPSNKPAVEKKAKAAELKQKYGDRPKPQPEPQPPAPDDPGVPVALIAGIGGGVVLAALLVFGLLWRRRRRNGPPPEEQHPPASGGAPPGYGQWAAGASRPRGSETVTLRRDPSAPGGFRPERPPKCPQCHWPYNPGAVFCTHCGHRLSEGQARSEGPDPTRRASPEGP
ncbi:trypsin-like peptidase domain-containing protein [Streptomyces sclerotialus]|uniref:trypsin-like peptidase domain-containing protein n=1 Tax=Streptomyces sclerotialus TaxID=1957 RepID=UPI0004C90D7A